MARSPIPRRREIRLDQPLERGRLRSPSYDPESFGRFSERIARFIGSWTFIAWMTVVIVAWLLFNIFAPESIRPDPYPFIFLTLLLSLQASYAAPLILLAQNRQSDRDRVQYLEDRAMTERVMADAEFLAREIASLRLALGDIATRDYLRGELRDAVEEITRQMDARIDAQGDPSAGTHDNP
ncbi:MAG: DUF1003 domain-containing protein [Candidatus Nanopelagicales bacterium]